MRSPTPVLSLTLALAACGGDSTRDVAVVGTQSLTENQLLGYVALASKAGPPTHAFVDAIAQGWLDFALVAEAAAAGVEPATLRREALDPWVRTQHLRRLQNDRALVRGPLTDQALEDAFSGDSLRVFQSVLVRAPERSAGFQLRSRRARADSILALARGGAPFDRLATELSEGPDAAGGGYQILSRQDVSDEFRNAVWGLGPGEVSPVLGIDEGFQVLRRPPFEEARSHLAAHILRAEGARADSLLADSLADAHGLSLLPRTADRLRDVLTNPDSLAPDSLPIVQFSDDGVTAEQAWSWLAALPDTRRLALVRASDADLEEVARSVATDELLYRLARAQGIRIGPGILAEPGEGFVAAADSLFQTFRGADASRRALLVDSIVHAVIAGEPTRPLPRGMASALRRRMPHAFDRDALLAVTRRASREADLLVN